MARARAAVLKNIIAWFAQFLFLGCGKHNIIEYIAGIVRSVDKILSIL